MIKIKQVTMKHGKGFLLMEYDMEGEVKQAVIDIDDVVERLLEFRQLVGRKPTKDEVIDVIVTMVRKIRRRREILFRPVFDFDKLIGVDLEAE